MSEKNTGYYPSHDGINNIFYRVYTPDCAPHAIVQICHGMTEYSGRYEAFAEYLVDHGVVVCANDHLGHGMSASLEDKGFFAENGGIGHLVEDVEVLRTLMRKKYPSLPYILFGHSMGSFIAREYISVHGAKIDGAVLCGTSAGGSDARLGLMLAKAIKKIKGPRYRSSLLAKIMNSKFTKKFKSEGEYAWLTRDRDIQLSYAADPDCTFIFTAAAYCDLLTMTAEVNTPEWYDSVRPDLPVLLTAGEDDPVGDYGEGVKRVWDALDDAGLSCLKIKLYEDCRHEILNELCRDQVYADILSFVDSVCDGVIKSRESTQW